MFKLALPVLVMASAAFAAFTPQMSLDQHDVARRSLSGSATYYGGNVQGGACSFSTYILPSGLYGAALSDSNWDTAANCGGCIAVSHGGKTVTAMVVDECPGCGDNHLDRFPDAFSALSNPSAGVIDITWDYVSCPHISGGLQIHLKTGVSEYWFAAQVVNAHRRTDKMEVSTDSGAYWQTATRTDYNFFEISSGLRAGKAWVKVTSHVGTTVVVKDVPMTPDKVVTASSNYV